MRNVGTAFIATLSALGALGLGACGERPLDSNPTPGSAGASGQPAAGGRGGGGGGFSGFGGSDGGPVDDGPSCGEGGPASIAGHVACTASAPLARIPLPLFSLTAATAPDGRIFLIGGSPQYSTNPGFLRVSVYDPATASFRALPSLPRPTGGKPAAAFAGNKLIAWDSDGWRYDMQANCWTPVPAPMTLINRAAATGSDGRAYFFGGAVPGGGATTAVHAYDGATDRWETMPSMPSIGDAMGATEVMGRIYLVGAWTASFDLATREWTVLAAPPVKRQLVGAAADGAGRVVMVGGSQLGGPGGDHLGTEIYDLRTNRWTTGASPLVGVSQMAVAAACGGAIFTFGGNSRMGIVDVVQAYDPVMDRWRISP